MKTPRLPCPFPTPSRVRNGKERIIIEAHRNASSSSIRSARDSVHRNPLSLSLALSSPDSAHRNPLEFRFSPRISAHPPLDRDPAGVLGFESDGRMRSSIATYRESLSRIANEVLDTADELEAPRSRLSEGESPASARRLPRRLSRISPPTGSPTANGVDSGPQDEVCLICEGYTLISYQGRLEFLESCVFYVNLVIFDSWCPSSSMAI